MVAITADSCSHTDSFSQLLTVSESCSQLLAASHGFTYAPDLSRRMTFQSGDMHSKVHRLRRVRPGSRVLVGVISSGSFQLVFHDERGRGPEDAPIRVSLSMLAEDTCRGGRNITTITLALSATRSTVVALADGSTRRIRFERHLHIRQPSVRRSRKPHL